MNPAALFMSVYDFTWEGLLAIYISGIPVRSCSCQFYIYFSVDWSKAIVGKAAADKNKI